MLRYLLLKIILTQHEICNSFEVHSVVVKKKNLIRHLKVTRLILRLHQQLQGNLNLI